MKHKLCLALLLGGVARAAADSVSVPVGTEIQVRLLSEASSEKPSGQYVEAVATVPVFVNGAIVISAGTRIVGKTSEADSAKPAADRSVEQPAKLRLNFTKIEDGSGQAQFISCVLEAVDNARESVDRTGLITGIAASETMEARIDQGIAKIAARNQQFGGLLAGVESAFVKTVDPSIDYKPGVDLTLKLTKALDWNARAAADLPGAVNPPEALAQLVNSEPFRTVAQSPPEPSDITNLMFIGTLDQVQQAFQEAGWFPASGLSGESKMETARAIIENRGYSEAPMSVLFLNGHPPSFTFQKQNNTFAMRHHIRIWQMPEQFDGKPVWVAAATHDISITFSQTSRSFTHGIDPDIDKERAKVVNDLLFTKRVHAIALVVRTGIPPDVSNATGDKLVTDGRMAVLQF